ncbi:hypothetical protein Lcho_2266 [Leptothrix cholodnii SP-6]|uniref:Phage-associated protein, BcepMu gp16 family n=2 Tax=Leptothrix cholodnii TaxID=34029 RepID=B1Y410_LEPCP|nr:hypothetical protein Lcho_2266 [Leptothrix cholodnii SP-6]
MQQINQRRPRLLLGNRALHLQPKRPLRQRRQDLGHVNDAGVVQLSGQSHSELRNRLDPPPECLDVFCVHCLTSTNSHHFARAMKPKLKTATEARAEFEHKGLSIAAWSRANGLHQSLVYEILAGRKKCHRGKSHKAAVLLGMKAGEIVDQDPLKQAA